MRRKRQLISSLSRTWLTHSGASLRRSSISLWNMQPAVWDALEKCVCQNMGRGQHGSLPYAYTVDSEHVWTLFLHPFHYPFNLYLTSLTDPLVMCKSFIIRQMYHAMLRSEKNAIHPCAEILKENHLFLSSCEISMKLKIENLQNLCSCHATDVTIDVASSGFGGLDKVHGSRDSRQGTRTPITGLEWALACRVPALWPRVDRGISGSDFDLLLSFLLKCKNPSMTASIRN